MGSTDLIRNGSMIVFMNRAVYRLYAPLMPELREIAKTIDHALLKPQTTREELDAGYAIAGRLGVASVCVMPFDIPRCVGALEGTGVEPSTVIGFPHGGHVTSVKVREAEVALAFGATELDMVINVSKAVSGDWDGVRSDIASVLEPTHGLGAKLKVIFETGHFDEAGLTRLCEICSQLRVDWVKTSTGFGPRGASEEDIELMRRVCPESVQVKASGGIRTLDHVLRFRELGCSRCGASGTEAILAEAAERLG